jgi:hypothetical protein
VPVTISLSRRLFSLMREACDAASRAEPPAGPRQRAVEAVRRSDDLGAHLGASDPSYQSVVSLEEDEVDALFETFVEGAALRGGLVAKDSLAIEDAIRIAKARSHQF